MRDPLAVLRTFRTHPLSHPFQPRRQLRPGARIDHHYDRPWKSSEPRDGRLVVIGLKGFDQGAVAAALAG